MTYSRLKDTSMMPRFPVGVGHKPTSREHLHTLLTRDPELVKRTVGDVVKLKALLKKSGEENPDDVIDNYIDSGRLGDINSKENDHTLRQLHRNRKTQQVRKIIENIAVSWNPLRSWYGKGNTRVKANADRMKRIRFKWPTDPNDPKASRRRVDSKPTSYRVHVGADVDNDT
jgi:hypothetical protein